MLLHHIGIVVPSIRSTVDGFSQTLGRSWDGKIIHDPLQGVHVAFLASVNNPSEPLIELVEPAGEDSPVTGFLKRGGGMNHLCYEVPSLSEQLKKSRADGSLIVKQPMPAVAFDGRLIGWVFTPQRMLVEFLEKQGLRPG
jgi:methylmalonyl-CoA/ethylmalonyl-CoA epimerase